MQRFKPKSYVKWTDGKVSQTGQVVRQGKCMSWISVETPSGVINVKESEGVTFESTIAPHSVQSRKHRKSSATSIKRR